MATKKIIHYSTLSSDSKAALQTGNSAKMLLQLKKLQLLYAKGSARMKGPLHRHVIAMKNYVGQHIKQLGELLDNVKTTLFSANFMDGDNTSGIPSSKAPANFPNLINRYNERDTLSKRWMAHRKTQRFNTRKKAKAVNSLNEAIYKHYFHKLTKLTKMRVDPVNPPYKSRAKARSSGCFPECNILSYEQKFMILLNKVKVMWKPRDYMQRKFDYQSLFTRLCANIVDCIRQCTSTTKGNRLDSMERLDILFGFFRRFKITSPTIRQRRFYRGGGPRKCMKAAAPECAKVPEFGYWGKRDAIGKEQLSIPVIDSLSGILQKQFNVEYGLQNVRDLYRASRISGPVSQRLKRFDLKAVPIGSHAVQIHFCHDHYVTSEQRPSGIVVWDSIKTSEDFKTELYSQLRLTYGMLSEYSETAKGLVKYKNDSNNMQEDYTSCGIFAVLRAYFILTNKIYKINTEIARAYLSDALENSQFVNYDIFSCSYSKSSFKMDAMMEYYMSNQNDLHSKKTKRTTLASVETVPSNRASRTVGERKRQLNVKKVTDNLQSKNKGKTSSQTSKKDASNYTDTPVRKRGRPAKYSPEEKIQKIKESKLKSYHKTKVSKAGTKRGRPAKYSSEERELTIKQNRLRSYHKTKGEKTLGQTEKHIKHMKLLRSNDKYRMAEKQMDKIAHKNRRNSIQYREAERQRDRENREQWRQHDVHRQVCIH